MMLNLPPEFIQTIRNAFQGEGASWLEALPVLLEEACSRWELRDVRPVPYLSYNFVAVAQLIVEWGCPKSQTALFDFPFDAHFYGYLWVLPIRKMPLSGIFSHFGLSKKKNLSFLDSPTPIYQKDTK
jgi:hypothetical protein